MNEEQSRKKEKELRELYHFVAEQVRAGLFKSDIIERLIELGIDKLSAAELVDEMQRRLKNIRQRTILIVMAPSPELVAIEKELTLVGYQVISREDQNTAVQELRTSVPDLIMTATDVPGIESLDFIKEIRNHPIGRRIPVFILSDRKPMQSAFKPFHLVQFIDRKKGVDELVRQIKRILFYRKGI